MPWPPVQIGVRHPKTGRFMCACGRITNQKKCRYCGLTPEKAKAIHERIRGTNPRFSRARYQHHRLQSPSRFDPHSFRVKRSGRARIIVGCPKGYYKKCRCSVGTRPQSILTPKRNADLRHQQFHGVPGRVAGKIHFTYPRRLVLIGRAVSVVYVPPRYSGKFFRTRKLRRAGEYIHRFGMGVKLYTTERGDAAILLGGKFRVTDWLRG